MTNDEVRSICRVTMKGKKTYVGRFSELYLQYDCQLRPKELKRLKKKIAERSDFKIIYSSHFAQNINL
jgi:hypothetical protein